MQLENDDDRNVFNGDLGFVTHADTDEGELNAEFDGATVTGSA